MTEQHRGNMIDDVAGDLVTTNELGNGERDYRLEGDDLLLDIYETDLTDANGFPVPDATYRVDITLTRIEEKPE